MRGLLIGSALASLLGVGCSNEAGALDAAMALRSFPIGDCDQDGVEDYATALLYGDYSDPHLSDFLSIHSGKSGQVVASCDLGRSRHTAEFLWAGAGLEQLGLLVRYEAVTEPMLKLVRMGRGGASEFLAELHRTGSDGRVVGIGVRAAPDVTGGVLVVICSAIAPDPASVECVLYRWSQGKSLELQRFNFRSPNPNGYLECAVGQFEGGAALDLAVAEPVPGKRDASPGPIYLIDGNSGEQRALAVGKLRDEYVGRRLAALRSSSEGTYDLLVIDSEDNAEPMRPRDGLHAFSPGHSSQALWELDGASGHFELTWDLQVLPDLDGDGTEDMGFVNSLEDSVEIVSGRTGTLMRRISHSPWQMIDCVTHCADADADGRPDLLLSVRPGRDADMAPDPADSQFFGCIVVSSADGRTLRRYPAHR